MADTVPEPGGPVLPTGDTTVESLAPLAEWIDALQDVVQYHAHARPYTTLIVAGAVGYVLAAGVPRFLTRVALGVGGRVLVARLASSLLEK